MMSANRPAFLFLLLLITWLAPGARAWALEPTVKVGAMTQDVSEQLIVWRQEKAEPLAVDALLQNILTGKAAAFEPNRKSWGYSAATLWLYGSFFNPLDYSIERVLALPFSSPTTADFFVFDAKGQLLKKVETGTFAPLEGRELKLNLTGIRLTLPAHDRVHVLIRQHSKSLLDTHYTLRVVHDHEKLEWLYLAGYGLYFGLALGLFFHNLSLYFAVRDKVYLAYLFTVFCVSSAMLFSSAYYSLFWYRTPTWLHNLPYATPGLSNIGATMFFCAFLYLKPQSSWIARGLVVIAALSLLSVLGTMISTHTFMPWNPFLNTITLLLGLAGCIAKVLRRVRYAWFLLIALLCPLLSVSAYYIGNFVFKTTVPSDLMSVAFGLEMILMSAGLSHRIYVLRQRQFEWEAQQEGIIYQSQMKALSEMASGMAHEINNPLMIISGYADMTARLLTRQPLDLQRIHGNTHKISKHVARIAFIVDALRSFASKGSDRPLEKVSLQDVVEQALCLYEAQIKDNRIELRIEANEEPRLVYGVRGQLIQALSALLDNAIKALRHAPVKRLDIRLSAATSEGSQPRAVITIRDSGPGIPRDIQSKIFQPFFTTHPLGEGIGLSLSRAQGLVRSFNGQLYLNTAAPLTEFIVELPLIGFDEKGNELRH